MKIEGEMSIIMMMKSLNSDSWIGNRRVDKDPNCAEAFVHRCTMVMEKKEDGNHMIRMFISVDPNISFVPEWLINFFIKIVVLAFLAEIEKKANKMPDTHQKLRREKTSYYGKVDRYIKRAEMESFDKLKELYKPEEIKSNRCVTNEDCPSDVEDVNEFEMMETPGSSRLLSQVICDELKKHKFEPLETSFKSYLVNKV